MIAVDKSVEGGSHGGGGVVRAPGGREPKGRDDQHRSSSSSSSSQGREGAVVMTLRALAVVTERGDPYSADDGGTPN